MNAIFNVLTKLFVFYLLLFSMSIQASEKSYSEPLVLKCVLVPQHSDQLCIIKTSSPYGPYDDVVFYRKTKQDEKFLLGSATGGVAVFSGFGFSDKGRYMWASWAEEGHAAFYFFDTDMFLSNGPDANHLASLHDDDLYEFVEFSDTGKVTYTKQPDDLANCGSTPCLYSLKLK